MLCFLLTTLKCPRLIPSIITLPIVLDNFLFFSFYLYSVKDFVMDNNQDVITIQDSRLLCSPSLFKRLNCPTPFQPPSLFLVCLPILFGFILDICLSFLSRYTTLVDSFPCQLSKPFSNTSSSYYHIFFTKT